MFGARDVEAVVIALGIGRANIPNDNTNKEKQGDSGRTSVNLFISKGSPFGKSVI